METVTQGLQPSLCDRAAVYLGRAAQPLWASAKKKSIMATTQKDAGKAGGDETGSEGQVGGGVHAQ